jgi:hypothetical protein
MLRRLLPLLGFLAASASIATEPADDNWGDDPFDRAAAVNEGDLVFLDQPPEKAVHHHVNRLSITDTSLADGWVALEQCHHDLDPVPDAEIVYAPGRIRNLRTTRVENIERVEVFDHSVQLKNVDHGSSICIQAETRALSTDGEGFVLKNGPYMRRFLDGYYPMRVTLQIDYPPDLMIWSHVPEARDGVRIAKAPGEFSLDAWFEGILRTRIDFDRR